MIEVMDVAVIGAGPCGLAAGAALKKAELKAVLFDRGCITQSIVGYPPYMTFFSTAQNLELEDIPFVVPGGKPTRQEALVYYRRVAEHFRLDVRQYQEVVSVTGEMGAFRIRSRRLADGEIFEHEAHSVVLAMGGFHQPNYLGVPGEDLPKVLHYYTEPYPYYDQDVVVVGAGNSAVESALELFRNGARVTMVHFGDTIDKGVKPWVVPDIMNRLEKKEIPSMFRSRIVEVRPRSVLVRHEGTEEVTELSNDWVFAMTGWQPDHTFIRNLGVKVDMETGIPEHDIQSMETNVRGIYIAGVLAAGYNANKIFIENGKWHGGILAQAILPLL